MKKHATLTDLVFDVMERASRPEHQEFRRLCRREARRLAESLARVSDEQIDAMPALDRVAVIRLDQSQRDAVVAVWSREQRGEEPTSQVEAAPTTARGGKP